MTYISYAVTEFFQKVVLTMRFWIEIINTKLCKRFSVTHHRTTIGTPLAVSEVVGTVV